MSLPKREMPLQICYDDVFCNNEAHVYNNNDNNMLYLYEAVYWYGNV